MPGRVAVAASTLKTLAIAAAGGALFNLLGAPMPWLLGALVVTIIAAQTLRNIHVPVPVRDVLQPVLGVSLGSFFTPALLAQASSWPKIAGILAVYIVIAALAGFLYFRRVANYDFKTAFICAVPGGFNELTMMGSSIGADVALVGLSHAVRILFVVITMPFVIAWVAGPFVRPASAAASAIDAADLVILIGCGIVGYGLGRLVRIPASTFMLPLFASAAIHLLQLSESSPPSWMLATVQVVAGAFVGARFGSLDWRAFRSALLHGLVWAVILTVLGIAGALIGAQATGIGLPQLILAYAPGGIAEMGLLTLGLGIDVAMVTTCHVLRLLMVFSVIPFAVLQSRTP